MVTIEGSTIEEILALPDDELDALILTDGPIVAHVGSAQVLGHFRTRGPTLTVELAHINGGGEGALATLWHLARRYAERRQLDEVEWIVHAVNCAAPNPKLRRVLERRGFHIESIQGTGEAYYFRDSLKPAQD